MQADRLKDGLEIVIAIRAGQNTQAQIDFRGGSVSSNQTRGFQISSQLRTLSQLTAW